MIQPVNRSTYVPHIDGLRAVAVLAVIVYHLNEHWLPGGLCGVDIFFVISGFVVSASLAEFKKSTASAFFAYFYARRMLRILPALLVCLLVTHVFAMWFIPYAWLSDANQQTGLYAFFGLSNYILADTHFSYFAPRTEFNPYTHTWSLGVEEQFYLIFPPLFAAWIAGGRGRAFSSAVFALGLVASLICAIWLSRTNPDFAFYMLYGRFWELSAGVLLYQLFVFSGHAFSEANRPATVLSQAGAIASAALVAAGLALAEPQSLPFPGALMPVARYARPAGLAVRPRAARSGHAAAARSGDRVHRPDFVFALSLALAGVRAVALDDRHRVGRRAHPCGCADVPAGDGVLLLYRAPAASHAASARGTALGRDRMRRDVDRNVLLRRHSNQCAHGAMVADSRRPRHGRVVSRPARRRRKTQLRTAGTRRARRHQHGRDLVRRELRSDSTFPATTLRDWRFARRSVFDAADAVRDGHRRRGLQVLQRRLPVHQSSAPARRQLCTVLRCRRRRHTAQSAQERHPVPALAASRSTDGPEPAEGRGCGVARLHGARRMWRCTGAPSKKPSSR